MTTTTDEHLLDVAEETLKQAIEHLRAWPNIHDRYEIANDLALLYERIRLRHPAESRRARLRLLKREEIADEVLRGEHDDHDWQVD
jgi:hypothetical protein